MEKEANQLYRRPQMTGQARDEEEDFIPLVVVMSVVQVFFCRPRDLLPSIFPSICCMCDVLCLIRCPYLDIVVSSS